MCEFRLEFPINFHRINEAAELIKSATADVMCLMAKYDGSGDEKNECVNFALKNYHSDQV